SSGQGQGRTADLPLFRESDVPPTMPLAKVSVADLHPLADQTRTMQHAASWSPQPAALCSHRLRSRVLESVGDARIRATFVPERTETAVTSGHPREPRTAS